MFKVIVYAGLSISYEESREILDSNDNLEVIYKPPIRRGDILEDIKENPDVIGIIDGVFHQSPSVAHKEILKVIEHGITVVGGSSMGALRASELDSFGMIGIGYVYNEYASGNIASDDDVAVALNSETLEKLSEALVNIDYIFKEAVKENIIDQKEQKELLHIAKSIYYPKRNYSIILKKSNLDDDKKNKLITFITNSKDIKKEDGKDVLTYIKNMMEKMC
jgi:hypothetical protein